MVYSGLLILEAVFILVGIIVGIVRGTGKGLVRVLTLLLSSLISLLLARGLGMLIFPSVWEQLLLQGGDELAALLAEAQSAVAIIKSIGTVLIAVLLLPLLFTIVRFITLAIYNRAVAKRPYLLRKPTALSRVGGAVLGALCGFLVAVHALAPFFVVMHLAVETGEQTRDVLFEELPSEEVSVLIAEDARPLLPNTVAMAVITADYADGMLYSLTRDIPKAFDTYLTLALAMEDSAIDEDSFGMQAKAFSVIVDDLEDSVFLRHALCAVIHGLEDQMTAISDGESEHLDESMRKMLDEITPDNIVDNLRVLFGDGTSEKRGLLLLLTEFSENAEGPEDLARLLEEIALLFDSEENADAVQALAGGVWKTALAEATNLQDPSQGREVFENMETLLRGVSNRVDLQNASYEEVTAAVSDTVTALAGDSERAEEVIETLAPFASYILYTEDSFRDGTPITAEEIAEYFGVTLAEQGE